MYVEALLDSPLHLSSSQKKSSPELKIEVFISDFHALRVQSSFEWILGLQPSLLEHVNMTIHSLPCDDLSASQKEERRQHELKGVQRTHRNRRRIKTMPELYRYVLLGGHKGIESYLWETYETSTAAGYQFVNNSK